MRAAVLQDAGALQYVSERLRTQHTFLLSLSCPKMNLVSKDWQQSPAGLETSECQGVSDPWVPFALSACVGSPAKHYEPLGARRPRTRVVNPG